MSKEERKAPNKILKEALKKRGYTMEMYFALARGVGLDVNEACRALDGRRKLSTTEFLFFCQCLNIKDEDTVEKKAERAHLIHLVK